MLNLLKVPRCHYEDLECSERINNRTPVIIRASRLVKSAFKWDIGYLSERMNQGPFTVFTHALQGIPTHYTTFKIITKDAEKKFADKLKPSVKRELLEWDQFIERYTSGRKLEKLHLEQSLESGIGEEIAIDVAQFNWERIFEMRMNFGWGDLTETMLQIGQSGNVMECSYEKNENLFCQMMGVRTFLLFSPDKMACLYPYHEDHPYEHFSQVDFQNPNLEIFPNFCGLKGYEAVLYPGDVLFLPVHWWHHVTNESDMVDIKFAFKASDGPTSI